MLVMFGLYMLDVANVHLSNIGNISVKIIVYVLKVNMN